MDIPTPQSTLMSVPRREFLQLAETLPNPAKHSIAG